MDIAFYDQKCEEKVLEDVRVFSNEYTNIEEGHYKGDNKSESAPSAILVNANNKGYCRIIIDMKSL